MLVLVLVLALFLRSLLRELQPELGVEVEAEAEVVVGELVEQAQINMWSCLLLFIISRLLSTQDICSSEIRGKSRW